MIILDMDMPKNCGECKTGICTKWMGMTKQELWNKRANDCPIKCDIDAIKTEIANYILSDDEKIDMDEDSIKWGIKIAYDIIDKHTKGDKG